MLADLFYPRNAEGLACAGSVSGGASCARGDTRSGDDPAGAKSRGTANGPGYAPVLNRNAAPIASCTITWRLIGSEHNRVQGE